MSIKKCIIPVAGRGTRFLPATKSVSKEMLPILSKPTILLLVQECYRSGIQEIIFVVGKHNYHLLQNFFTNNQELNEFLGNDPKRELLNELEEIIANVKFQYVYQDENIRGTAGAIYAARNFIDNEYFGVMYGDDLIKANQPVLKQLILEHEKNNCNVIGVGEVPFAKVSNYGVVAYKEDNIVSGIIEKPKLEEAPSNHVLQGRLILNSTIFDKILTSPKHNNNEYYLPEALMSLNEEVRAVKYQGNYYDIGNKLGYLKANIAYGLEDNTINQELKEYLKGIINDGH